MSNVLLIINEEAHVRELSRVADLLLSTPDLRPVVFIEDRVKHLGELEGFAGMDIEVLTSAGITERDGRSALGKQGRNIRRWRAHFLVESVRAVARVFPLPIRNRPTALANINVNYIDLNRDLMLRRAAVCEAVLKQRTYAAVVMSEDNVELDTAVWIAVARKNGVRSVIVPYTISNTAEFAESCVNNSALQVLASLQNRITARLFPEWTLRYKNQHFLRSPYAKIIAVEALGLAPPNPWLLNSGFADAIAVESVAMLDYYRAAGIPDPQLVETGSLTDDAIVAVHAEAPQRRYSLLQEYGLGDDRPLLLCALPPDQKTYKRRGCEFSDFDNLIDFWGECLSAIHGWNVVVRPHPKTSPDRLGALRRHKLNISYADTATLVPLCDLYVAAVSATIRWAIACGKPVINFDVYQYGYQDYEDVEGVVLVNTRDEFRALLERITRDNDYRARLADLQRKVSGRWGRLDGACGRRMIALLRGEAMAESELATAASDLSMAVVPAAVSASLRQGAPHGFPALSVGSNEE